MAAPRFTVEIYHDLAPYLAGISTRTFFEDDDQLIAAWEKATQWTQDTFHGRLAPRTPTAAPLSYGHLVCLGAPLKYSEQAEPNVGPATDSLEEAIRLLEDAQGMDFSACPIFKKYARTSARVREVFPTSPVLGGLGMEGPVTSAALFLGDAFYMDAIEEPERCARYLSLMTDSVIAFRQQLNASMGAPRVSPGGGYLADDLASMLPPHLWDSLVVPYWQRYYQACTTGPRHFLHCEAVVPAQLPYLRKAGVTFYQPSVSQKLTLRDMQALGLPFDWLLYAFEVTRMDDGAMADWVRRAADAGAANIRTQFGEYAVRAGKIDRIQAFLDIADTYARG